MEIFRERAKIVLDFLVDEIDNKDVPGHELRCVPHLAECFYNIIDCQNEILMDTINKIMLKTRSQSSKVFFSKNRVICLPTLQYIALDLRVLDDRISDLQEVEKGIN